MIQNALANWKTTSAGLTAIIGAIVHMVFTHKTADENAWMITIGAIIGGLGLIFAGDASHSEKSAVAIDKMNQMGTSPDAKPLALVNKGTTVSGNVATPPNP